MSIIWACFWWKFPWLLQIRRTQSILRKATASLAVPIGVVSLCSAELSLPELRKADFLPHLFHPQLDFWGLPRVPLSWKDRTLLYHCKLSRGQSPVRATKALLGCSHPVRYPYPLQQNLWAIHHHPDPHFYVDLKVHHLTQSPPLPSVTGPYVLNLFSEYPLGLSAPTETRLFP